MSVAVPLVARGNLLAEHLEWTTDVSPALLMHQIATRSVIRRVVLDALFSLEGISCDVELLRQNTASKSIVEPVEEPLQHDFVAAIP